MGNNFTISPHFPCGITVLAALTKASFLESYRTCCVPFESIHCLPMQVSVISVWHSFFIRNSCINCFFPHFGKNVYKYVKEIIFQR